MSLYQYVRAMASTIRSRRDACAGVDGTKNRCKEVEYGMSVEATAFGIAMAIRIGVLKDDVYVESQSDGPDGGE
jgi:hypothetical protein